MSYAGKNYKVHLNNSWNVAVPDLVVDVVRKICVGIREGVL